jgi:hypothetical protein
MYQKYLLISAVLFALTACMSSNDPSQLNGADSTAKIRVFQQADVTLYPGEHCYGSNNPRAIHAAQSGFSIFGTHKRAGMPVTEDISAAYNEYVIQAGKPLTVMLQWTADKGGVKSSCGPLGSTFFPQAGKNYDVSLLGSADHCMLQVRELYETAPGKAVAKLAPVSPSFACAGK